MKLPVDSIIDPRKVSHYMLRPLKDSDKSSFLAGAGYESDSPSSLLADIREQLLPHDAELIRPFEYGTKISYSRHFSRFKWSQLAGGFDLGDYRSVERNTIHNSLSGRTVEFPL